MATRTVQDWLDAYGESHRNPVNKALHWVCVPAIVLSLAALLAEIPAPMPEPMDWALLVLLAAVLFYLRLSRPLAVGMAVFVLLVLLGIDGLAQLPWPVWQSAGVIFVVAWVGQFIGHAIEGRRPSFFQDLQFLMIGPLWLLAALYRRLGIRY